MSVKKSTARSRRFRKSVSQHISERSKKKEAEKVFVQQKNHAGKVNRGKNLQVSGGEGRAKKWWKATTITKSNSSTTKVNLIIEKEEEHGIIRRSLNFFKKIFRTITGNN